MVSLGLSSQVPGAGSPYRSSERDDTPLAKNLVRIQRSNGGGRKCDCMTSGKSGEQPSCPEGRGQPCVAREAKKRAPSGGKLPRGNLRRRSTALCGCALSRRLAYLRLACASPGTATVAHMRTQETIHGVQSGRASMPDRSASCELPPAVQSCLTRPAFRATHGCAPSRRPRDIAS